MSQTLTTTIQPIPYLSFNGNCAEAIRFYAQALGGKIVAETTYGNTPMADQMPDAFKDKIVNAQLELPGEGLLYGGDCPPHITWEGVRGVTLALNFPTVAEAETAFNALSAGGNVTMPFSDTFWAKKFGMVDDKFGHSWLINGELLM